MPRSLEPFCRAETNLRAEQMGNRSQQLRKTPQDSKVAESS